MFHSIFRIWTFVRKVVKIWSASIMSNKEEFISFVFSLWKCIYKTNWIIYLNSARVVHVLYCCFFLSFHSQFKIRHHISCDHNFRLIQTNTKQSSIFYSFLLKFFTSVNTAYFDKSMWVCICSRELIFLFHTFNWYTKIATKTYGNNNNNEKNGFNFLLNVRKTKLLTNTHTHKP